MKRARPVLTIRLGSHIPTVKIGIMAAKQTAYPAEYTREFRSTLPMLPTVCRHNGCKQTIIKANPKHLCEKHLWEQEWGFNA